MTRIREGIYENFIILLKRSFVHTLPWYEYKRWKNKKWCRKIIWHLSISALIVQWFYEYKFCTTQCPIYGCDFSGDRALLYCGPIFFTLEFFNCILEFVSKNLIIWLDITYFLMEKIISCFTFLVAPKNRMRLASLGRELLVI